MPILAMVLTTPLIEPLRIVVNRLVEVHVQHVVLDHLVDGIEGHVGIDGVRAVADEGGEVMDLAGLAGFEDDGDPGAGAGARRGGGGGRP